MKLGFGYEAETIFAATRARAYFNGLGGQPRYLTYAALADAIADLQPKVVGLYRSRKSPIDYPLYVLLKERLPDVRVTYYDVWNNPSASLADMGGALPDVVVKSLSERRPAHGENTAYETHLTHADGASGDAPERMDDAMAMLVLLPARRNSTASSSAPIARSGSGCPTSGCPEGQ